MYQITFHPRRRLIHVTFAGMLEVDEARRYVAELGDGFVRHRFRTGFLFLIDCSRCAIHSQEVMAVFNEHRATFPKPARVAVVVGDAMARMQVRRALAEPRTRIVETVAEAECWLNAATPVAGEPMRAIAARVPTP